MGFLCVERAVGEWAWAGAAMKLLLLKLVLNGMATVALLLSLLGLVWSMVPLWGETLPHRVEQSTGLSFHWSALLVSSVVGIMGVGALGVFSVSHILGTDPEAGW